ncbi:MAG: CsgG/HfaB family protein [Mariprofundales bacterium]|nr:CsgG/HfaB family protein [Mariprofundales bacterium]
MQKFFASATLGLLLVGCATTKVDVESLEVSGQDRAIAANTLPSYAINGHKPRIAVLPAANETSFKQCNLAGGLSEQVTNAFVKAGSYTVVERAQLGALMNEVKFAAGLGGHLDSRKLQKLAKQVDYVIVTSASGAQVKANFTEARSWTDDKGQSHYIPPSCTEIGKANISLRVVTFPSGEIKNSITQPGVETNSHEVRYASQCRVQDACGMLTSAMAKAVDDKKEELANIAPVYGYIYKIRSNKNQRIASVSIGKSSGLKVGASLSVIQFTHDTDPVRHTSIQSEETIAHCEVIGNGLTANKALCLIKGKHANMVKIKHAVRVKHQKSTLGNIKQQWHSFQNLIN